MNEYEIWVRFMAAALTVPINYTGETEVTLDLRAARAALLADAALRCYRLRMDSVTGFQIPGAV